ncbi:MAG TPA: FecR domain-containing protein [Terriglobales bacterium]|nr:FecR domain-containing protein [Terriglobales bacterium]
MNSISRGVHLGAFLLLAASGGIACAIDAGNPSARVARLQYLEGDVSIQPHGTGEWVQGSIIRPLSNADNVWADKNSRAELNLGSGRLRIDSETSLTLTEVNDRSVQVELHQGVLNVHVRRLGDGEMYQVDTPNLAFTVTRAGDYRIDVSPNEDSTVVTVHQGEGQARGHVATVSVHAGERTKFEGSSLQRQVREVPREDGFDQWCQVRDQRLDQAASEGYSSHSDDLDEYQAWRGALAYGPTWAPTAVVPVWAPYPYWIWVNPWGPTSVGGPTWGLPPFSYGGWVYYGYHASRWSIPSANLRKPRPADGGNSRFTVGH